MTRLTAMKRAVDEVVPPAFVARPQQDGGAYSISEMPKRFMLGYMANNKDRDMGDLMGVFEAMDARDTAMNVRVGIFADNVIRVLRAEDAARAAAGLAGQSPRP